MRTDERDEQKRVMLDRGESLRARVVDALPAAVERLTPYVRQTPVERSAGLSDELGLDCWLKLEQLQYTGSFKLRGALNRLLQTTERERETPVVAASSGNHGLAVAHACRQLGLAGEVHVSAHANPAKLELLRHSGIALVEHDDPDTAFAERAARAAAEASGALFVSPYNDLHVVSGQATLGAELIDQLPELDVVVVAVGGGGLINGIAAAIKAVKPDVQVVAAWASNSAALYYALEAGAVVDYPELPTLSDGTAGGMDEDSITLPLAARLIDETVLLSEDELLTAGKRLLQSERWLVEGSAALAMAGATKLADRYRGSTLAVVLCGRNTDARFIGRLIADA